MAVNKPMPASMVTPFSATLDAFIVDRVEITFDNNTKVTGVPATEAEILIAYSTGKSVVVVTPPPGGTFLTPMIQKVARITGTATVVGTNPTQVLNEATYNGVLEQAQNWLDANR